MSNPQERRDLFSQLRKDHFPPRASQSHFNEIWEAKQVPPADPTLLAWENHWNRCVHNHEGGCE